MTTGENRHSQSGLQAMSTTISSTESPKSMSTSHFLYPCIFHRLMRSLPPSVENTTTKSLSGQHEAGNRREDGGICIVASEAMPAVSVILSQMGSSTGTDARLDEGGCRRQTLGHYERDATRLSKIPRARNHDHESMPFRSQHGWTTGIQ